MVIGPFCYLDELANEFRTLRDNDADFCRRNGFPVSSPSQTLDASEMDLSTIRRMESLGQAR